MRYVFWGIKLILFLALLGFALKNDQPVVLHYYLGYEWYAPLIIYLLIFFVAGVGLGILTMLGFIFRRQREISRLKHELRARHQSRHVSGQAVSGPSADGS